MSEKLTLLTRKEISEMCTILDEMYPEAECELEYGNTFQLLTAVMLSAQTTDKSVNKVTPALFARFPDAQTMNRALAYDEEATIAEIEQTIKSIGMYKTKSKNVAAMSRKLCELYDGCVPNIYEELIDLPGVGRKTANVVLSVGFGQQRIAVDTHVFRVANRIGIVHEKNVLKTELALMEALPEERWTRMHHNLIFHGRYCCDARKPKCATCELYRLCKWQGKKKFQEA